MPNPMKNAAKGLIQKIEKNYTITNSKIGELANIGRPCVYHNTIDPNHRISEFFRTRMNIIDLLPCDYKVDFSKITEEGGDSSGLVPQIAYDEAMARFKNDCIAYGLDGRGGVRIYTLDDTQASDSIGNTLKENYFQSGLNKMSELAAPIREALRSIDSGSIESIEKEASKRINTSGLFGDGVGRKLYETAKDVVVKGHRVTLPSVWSNSSYTPNFTANIRLSSPYGHPEAVKEFLIKPLMYLLILTSPKTEDGVSYGRPFFVTIKAYGLNYSPIGMVSNITMRRGGNDGAFNIFRQPTTIDVSLDFQYAVGGFAHYDGDKINPTEQNIFHQSAEPEYLAKEQDTALPTVGQIIKSLRPRAVDSQTIKGYSNMSEARNTKPLGPGLFTHVAEGTLPKTAPSTDEEAPKAENDIQSSQGSSTLASSKQSSDEISKQPINPNISPYI